MSQREEDIFRAASMYYLQDETMDVIAKRLGVSRSTVSRMISTARESGMVQISLHRPEGTSSATAARLAQTFGVQAHVVPVRESVSNIQRLDQVARVAAHLVTDILEPDMVLGIAWGTTLSAVSMHLRPRQMSGVTVVQMNGAANTHGMGIGYSSDIMQGAARAFDADVVHFPVPAFFDYPETKEALWRERAVRRVLELQRRANIVVFGIGSPTGEIPSHVYQGGYLDQRDVEALRAQRVVGDVCTVFLREDGTWQDVEINSRASGPTPAELRRLPRRIAVAAGDYKVPALVGALRARVATDLVIDEPTARLLLERVTR